jgi:hypothetical protein
MCLELDKSFGEAFWQFVERHGRREKKTWKKDVYHVNRFLSHWFSRPLASISKLKLQSMQWFQLAHHWETAGAQIH